MQLNNLLISTSHVGYIAGAGDGIITVTNAPSQRDIILFDAQNLAIVQRSSSLKNGHYLLNNLDPNKQYLVMARDYNKEYEPAVWDYVTPATDLTIAEQQELWQSWQTSP